MKKFKFYYYETYFFFFLGDLGRKDVSTWLLNNLFLSLIN